MPDTVSNNLCEAGEAELKVILGINAKVILMEPNSLPRSEGKSVRVIDKRKLLD